MRKVSLLILAIICVAINAFAASTDSEGMPIIYLRGDFRNTGWSATPDYRFIRNGNDYSLTINKKNALEKCQFKISDDDWIFNLGGAEKDICIDSSVYIDGQLNGSNLSTNGLNDCVISFTYNDEKATSIKFIVNGIEPEPPVKDDDGDDDKHVSVYLRGDFTGWQAVDKYKFKRSGETYTFTITPQTPIPAGSYFKIADADWDYINFGGDVFIDSPGQYILHRNDNNVTASKELTDGTISFTCPDTHVDQLAVTFSFEGEVKPVKGLSGTLPVLYINVFADEAHSAYNNEIISKDLAHKEYFNYAEYWLDVNDCEWLQALGAENVGSADKPLALQIKARGNWTRTAFAKKPFKLKLDKKQNLLGLSKSKHFALMAHADDNMGYLRNFVGFNLGKRIGLPWTPAQQPVEVVINGDYRGLYFLTESIRVDQDRVNIHELDDYADDAALVSGGYIVELDNYDEPDESQIRMDEKSCAEKWCDKLRITFDSPEAYSSLQRRFITDQFTDMNNYVGTNNDLLWAYMDLDDAVRYYLVEEIVSHTESFHGSTYLFRDRGEGQKWHFSPLWDFGNAFNGYTNDFFYNHSPFGNTWIPSMRLNKAFNDKVKATWLWFMANEFDGLFDDIDQYVGYIAEAAKFDHNRWKDAEVPANGQGVADNSYMPARRNFVVNHINEKTQWLASQFGDFTSGVFAEPPRDTTPAAKLPPYAVAAVNAVDFGDANAPAEYYNLQGIRVAEPSAGIYIRVSGGIAEKVFVK